VEGKEERRRLGRAREEKGKAGSGWAARKNGRGKKRKKSGPAQLGDKRKKKCIQMHLNLKLKFEFKWKTNNKIMQGA
jgi:hypothetical protein